MERKIRLLNSSSAFIVCIIGVITITRQNGSLFSTELDLGEDHELEVGDFGPNNMPVFDNITILL